MSDAKLRELERRWRETKSVEDEAAYLRERVRSGEVTEERLRLAAYLGDVAATHLLGPDSPVPPEGIVAWVHGLEAIGPEVSARAVHVREIDPDRTHIQEWALAFDHDRMHITKRVRKAYARHLLSWALGQRESPA